MKLVQQLIAVSISLALPLQAVAQVVELPSTGLLPALPGAPVAGERPVGAESLELGQPLPIESLSLQELPLSGSGLHSAPRPASLPRALGGEGGRSVGARGVLQSPRAEVVQRSGAIFDRSRSLQGLPGLNAAADLPSVDVFSALTKEQKARFESNYAEHLRLKDGDADVKNQKFSVREKFYQDLVANPVTMSNTGIDEKAFYRNEAKRNPEKGLNQATLWALIMAKANRSEREGVERRLARVDFSKRSPRDPLSFIEIEESYHTRVLKDALKIVGLDMKELPPQKLTSYLVRFMARLPMSISNILIMSSEVAGVALFRVLRDHARVMFKDQPEEARARVDALMQQILVDEVGHVHFVRSQLGPVRLWIAKKMLPFLARYFMIDLPEAGLLFGKKELLKKIVAADIDGASAEYPNKLDPYKTTELPPAPPAASVFSPMTNGQKAWFLKRYVEFLRGRDGEPDTKTKSFSVREKFFDELAKNPIAWKGAPPVDPATYSRNEGLNVPESALSAKTMLAQRALWALMTGKANRGEAYAVEQLMKRADYKKGGADNPMTWIAIEEVYHTRILKDALKVLGLDMRVLPPPMEIRPLAFLMARLPKYISNVFVMTSEVIGVATFKLLRDKAHELFADQPEALARIDALFQQIIVDEVGHVNYVRSQLGPVRLWIAKKLVPVALAFLMRRGSEAELLFGRKAMIEEAKKADIDGAAAGYPDRFIPFP
jgi:hypothetical protein